MTFGILSPGSTPIRSANYTAVSAGNEMPEGGSNFYLGLEEEAESTSTALELAAAPIGILIDRPVADLSGELTLAAMTRRVLEQRAFECACR